MRAAVGRPRRQPPPLTLPPSSLAYTQGLAAEKMMESTDMIHQTTVRVVGSEGTGGDCWEGAVAGLGWGGKGDLS